MVLDMLELTIKSFVAIYIIRLVLKHNLFISKLIIKIKFLASHLFMIRFSLNYPKSSIYLF
ncbi:MAG: hypothetical protein DBY38_11450 [Clostridium cadaveris]|uniref:Uncharacterized protein n=1 Tax=Clostridium cadaveris TaxID=1529 RepID=A0A316M1V5_9CLOT|nr:MAG: hypothetical protein DBY38_11450 [Clostridium cadaveris]